jgi:hypothetical protein
MFAIGCSCAALIGMSEMEHPEIYSFPDRARFGSHCLLSFNKQVVCHSKNFYFAEIIGKILPPARSASIILKEAGAPC